MVSLPLSLGVGMSLCLVFLFGLVLSFQNIAICVTPNNLRNDSSTESFLHSQLWSPGFGDLIVPAIKALLGDLRPSVIWVDKLKLPLRSIAPFKSRLRYGVLCTITHYHDAPFQLWKQRNRWTNVLLKLISDFAPPESTNQCLHILQPGHCTQVVNGGWGNAGSTACRWTSVQRQDQNRHFQLQGSHGSSLGTTWSMVE